MPTTPIRSGTGGWTARPCVPRSWPVSRWPHVHGISQEPHYRSLYIPIKRELGGKVCFGSIADVPGLTWGMAYPAGEVQDFALREKLQYAYRTAGLTAPILRGSMYPLASRIAFKRERPHVVVFNSLSHERTEVARVQRPVERPHGEGAGCGRRTSHRGRSLFAPKKNVHFERVSCIIPNVQKQHC
jgi:hypothetical protein